MLIAIFNACGNFSWVGESDKMVEEVDKDKLFQAKAFSEIRKKMLIITFILDASDPSYLSDAAIQPRVPAIPKMVLVSSTPGHRSEDLD